MTTPHPAAIRAAEKIEDYLDGLFKGYPELYIPGSRHDINQKIQEIIACEYEPIVSALTNLLEVLQLPEETAPHKTNAAINKAMEAITKLTTTQP